MRTGWLLALFLAGCASAPEPIRVRVVQDKNLVSGCKVLGTVSTADVSQCDAR